MVAKEANKEVYQNLHDFIPKLHTTLTFLNSYFKFQLQEDDSTWNLSKLKSFPFTALDLGFAMKIMQPSKFYFSAAWMMLGW